MKNRLYKNQNQLLGWKVCSTKAGQKKKEIHFVKQTKRKLIQNKNIKIFSKQTKGHHSTKVNKTSRFQTVSDK